MPPPTTRDEACISFLQWALPQLAMRWAGFRKVRGQVCKRLTRRLQQLGLPDLKAYRAYLDTHPAEWDELDRMCRNLVFMYFDDALQRRCLSRLRARLRPGGLLVLGKHGTLPDAASGFTAVDEHQRIYQMSGVE